MHTRKLLERFLILLVLTSLVLSSSVPLLAEDHQGQAQAQGQGQGQGPGDKKKIKDWYDQKIKKEKEKKEKRITPADRQAAAERAAAAGFDAAAVAAALPGDTPRYFSHPNYANSPLPIVDYPVTTTQVGNPLVDRTFASDYPVGVGELAQVFVVPPAVLPAGTLISFQTWNQANQGSSPFPSAGNIFHAYLLRPTGVANEYTVIFDSGELTVPALADPLVSELATFPVAPVAVQDGDQIAFFGQGIPLDGGVPAGQEDAFIFPAAAPPAQGATITLGSPEFPFFGTQDRTYSFGAVVDAIGTPVITGGIHKFVDSLPGLNGSWGPDGPVAVPNNIGQEIPVAVPDTTTYPGSDYYVIELVEYTEQMHSDLPPTTLRGYRQAGGNAHYLGPAIVATKDRPVRILFRNLLPTGLGGNLFIPTDVTVMGSGMGPSLGGMIEDTAGQVNPMCGEEPKPVGCFTENRATVHLHGGISPWISDGTPHQWITPAGERPYPDADQGENKGVSVAYVPDMWFDANGATIGSCAGSTTCDVPGATNYPGEGVQTYYWTNQQSSRLMFYHDHAWGITRLNVYAGEAAPYIIQDDTEKSLIDANLIPGPLDTIPLVVQDKTFVPSPEQIAWQDSTWDYSRWGDEGDLWLPHVYSPAQNPGDASGVNEFGRWAYGPWFWPPTLNILYPPLTNTYYDPDCNPSLGWCEPQMMPGTPYNSMGMEAFHDTPVVNGTAYPTITLEPKAYRLRFLNAANDRFFNLSLYKAVDANGVLCDADNPAPAAESTGVACTEVPLNPDELAAALEAPPDIFPTPLSPDPAKTVKGPDWMQIGTEGGFLPAPVVIPAQFTTWVVDPALFIAGLVDKHSLLLGPAERADVIVDFSQFAGHTLILYNDAPAAFPARDPRYDLYTGNADLRATGGPPPTLPGYGPNTRTVMRIEVKGTAAPAFDLAALETAFMSTNLGGLGVFENGQHPIIVGQAAYNSAYGTSFGQAAGDPDGFARITDFSMTFDTLSGVQMLDFPFQPKAIQDEMGEAFDHEYGRMSGNLGLEVPLTGAGVLQNLILYPYSNPASELIDATNLPWALNPDNPGDTAWEVQPISQANDGTQIWKITHNGVDTHPIHFHLYDVQLLNRVGWDGMILPPDENELGWKDTVRISPLEDTIVALRPVRPLLPWDLPNSVRLLNPAMPEGSTVAFNSTDENANPTPPITNLMTNFGWEYVWHCHILSHEEMDMMRPQMVAEPPPPVTDLVGEQVTGKDGGNKLTWTDPSVHETGFQVYRAASPNGPWSLSPNGTVGAGVTTYTDTTVKKNDIFFYQVFAINTVGFTGVQGYKNLTAKSAGSNIVQLPASTTPPTLPAAPTNLTATLQAGPQVLLEWTDNSNDETGFVIERAVGGGAFATLVTLGANTRSYTDVAVLAGNNYTYRVAAVNAAGLSTFSDPASVALALAPAAPTGVAATAGTKGKNATITLTWADVVVPPSPAEETGYFIQLATDAAFTANVQTASVGADITTYTFTKLALVTPYYLRVQAFNDAGKSAWANALQFPIVTP